MHSDGRIEWCSGYSVLLYISEQGGSLGSIPGGVIYFFVAHMHWISRALPSDLKHRPKLKISV